MLDCEVTVMADRATDDAFAVRLKELGFHPKSRSGWGNPTESKGGAIRRSRCFECAKKANKGPRPHCSCQAKEVLTAEGEVTSRALFHAGQHDHRIAATQIDPARGLHR